MENLSSKAKQEVILFDSETHMNDEFYDGELILDDLAYSVEQNTTKPRGDVKQWVLLSKRFSIYGSICNNGAYGYYDLKGEDLAQEILNIETDRIVLKDNNGKLQVNLYDHDGVHMCEVKSISKSRSNYYNSVLEYESFNDKLEYIKKLPSLKIKKSK